MNITDKVTIVLLTHNSARFLKRTLDNLTGLPGKPAIIAVDNSSKDKTLEILDEYGIDTIALPKNLGAAARNIGVRRANTPYVAFCDDDVYWKPGSLQKVVEYFSKYPELTLINPKIVVGDKEKTDDISREMAKSPLDSGKLPGHKLLSFMGGANAVRRDAFLQAGGFEPKLFMGGEEELLATDLAVNGAEMRYLPDITVHHFPSGQNAERLRAYGVRNALWLVWRRRSFKNAWIWTKHIYQTADFWQFFKGFAGFLKGLPWAIRTRRAVSKEIERQLELLDKQRLGAKTRDYSGG
jgi:N-acetylglucosaminyl-diphospho-decaprenol L-rhamnosyltransferase